MKIKFFTLSSLALLLFPPLVTLADMPPLSEISFNLKYETAEPEQLIFGELLRCSSKEKCENPRFSCGQNSCSILEPMRKSRELRTVMFRFSDTNEIRKSDIFEITSLDPIYNITVTDRENLAVDYLNDRSTQPIVSADGRNMSLITFNFIDETTKSIPDGPHSAQLLFCTEIKGCEEPETFLRNVLLLHCSQDLCSKFEQSTSDHYRKLIIKFSDKIRESDVFEAASFDPVYNVTVTDDSRLAVNYIGTKELSQKISSEVSIERRSESDFMNSFWNALIITLAIELLMALAFLLLTGTRPIWKILLLVLLVNVFSLPIVWFVFPMLKLGSRVLLILAEIFAVFFEAALIFWLSKKSISFVKSFIMSMLMNACSALLGPLLLLFIYSLIDMVLLAA